MMTSENRHTVSVTQAGERRLVECSYCGPLGVSDCQREADVIRVIHRDFTSVLIDAWDIDR
jgi:hypothetical protein